MFPRRYFAGSYFAPRFFPQSQGTVIQGLDVDNTSVLSLSTTRSVRSLSADKTVRSLSGSRTVEHIS